MGDIRQSHIRNKIKIANVKHLNHDSVNIQTCRLIYRYFKFDWNWVYAFYLTYVFYDAIYVTLKA